MEPICKVTEVADAIAGLTLEEARGVAEQLQGRLGSFLPAAFAAGGQVVPGATFLPGTVPFVHVPSATVFGSGGAPAFFPSGGALQVGQVVQGTAGGQAVQGAAGGQAIQGAAVSGGQTQNHDAMVTDGHPEPQPTYKVTEAEYWKFLDALWDVAKMPARADIQEARRLFEHAVHVMGRSEKDISEALQKLYKKLDEPTQEIVEDILNDLYNIALDLRREVEKTEPILETLHERRGESELDEWSSRGSSSD